MMYAQQPSPLLDSLTDPAGQVSIDLPTLIALISGGGAPVDGMPSISPTPMLPPPLGMGQPPLDAPMPMPPSNLEVAQQQAMMQAMQPQMSPMDQSESLGVPGPQIGKPGRGRR